MTIEQETAAKAVGTRHNCEITTEGRNTVVVKRRDGRPLDRKTTDAMVEQLMTLEINVSDWQFV